MKRINHISDKDNIMWPIIFRQHKRFRKFVMEMTMKFSKSAMFAHKLVLLVFLSIGLNGCGGGGGSDAGNSAQLNNEPISINNKITWTPMPETQFLFWTRKVTG